MKATIRGSITPPRGTPGANGAYIVDLEVDIPESMADRLLAALDTFASATEAFAKTVLAEAMKESDDGG